MRPANAPRPAQVISIKQMIAPAAAPDRLTPFIQCAKAVNASVIAAAIQKVVQSVRQVRGQSPANQVPDCHLSLCANQGAGALATCVLIVGDERP